VHCLFVFTSSCLLEGSCLVCSFLPPVVCRRAHVLDVRLYLQLFVGGLMYCLFVFTSSFCRRAHVLFVRLYLQFFVGGPVYCFFVFISSCL
jgi:hypothetical protein